VGNAVFGEKKCRPNFQVLFMLNDRSQDVEVFEVESVDFCFVEERLKMGQTVFITSKKPQMVTTHKNRAANAGHRNRAWGRRALQLRQASIA
jgi:hypothetical protein